jgi:hypothetical protein
MRGDFLVNGAQVPQARQIRIGCVALQQLHQQPNAVEPIGDQRARFLLISGASFGRPELPGLNCVAGLGNGTSEVYLVLTVMLRICNLGLRFKRPYGAPRAKRAERVQLDIVASESRRGSVGLDRRACTENCGAEITVTLASDGGSEVDACVQAHEYPRCWHQAVFSFWNLSSARWHR